MEGPLDSIKSPQSTPHTRSADQVRRNRLVGLFEGASPRTRQGLWLLVRSDKPWQCLISSSALTVFSGFCTTIAFARCFHTGSGSPVTAQSWFLGISDPWPEVGANRHRRRERLAPLGGARLGTRLVVVAAVPLPPTRNVRAAKLSRTPREIICGQVYTSFRHERSALSAHTSEGYPNVMWGSDYPHLEGTYGHTQETLHELFDDQPPEVSERVRFGAFRDLFPHTAAPPAA